MSLPPDIDNLTMSMQIPVGDMLVCNDYSNDQHIDDIDSDQEEEAANESDQDSENDEDLPLEMDEGRNVSKVRNKNFYNWKLVNAVWVKTS